MTSGFVPAFLSPSRHGSAINEWAGLGLHAQALAAVHFQLHSRGEWNIRTTAAVTLLDMPQESLTLLQGTVDLLVLRALQGGPAHGYTVSRWVRERTDGVLAIEDAALYQALHRLEAKGSVQAEWGLSDNNRRAKYYSLTPAGRHQLRQEISAWKRYSAAMVRIVEPA